MQNRRTFLGRACGLALMGTSNFARAASYRETNMDTEAEGDNGLEFPHIEIVGDWQVRVSPGGVQRGRSRLRITKEALLTVAPATVMTVKDEKYDSLPLFNAQAAPWTRGAKLRQLTTFETTAAGMLVPESLVLKSGAGEAMRYLAGKDYALEPLWATFGRLPGGIPEGQPVWADYVCGWGRIDSLVVDRKGVITLVQGTPHNATPVPAKREEGKAKGAETWTLANIWVPGRLMKLTEENLYPVLEAEYPTTKRSGMPTAATLLPKTWAKLHNGQPLHVLAWGDSVTAGGQASDAAHQYQSQFVSLLKEQFPHAAIKLTTAGWGGRNSDSFLKEPPGAEFNFDRAVIAPHPDLIVMEFVNDAFMTPEVVEQKYSYLQQRFAEIGAEWIILTPHFVRPDWMGAPSVRVEADPRPYVAGVRQFTAKHRVALADASLRWGHLLKEGIPYITLLSNSINHPNDRGHELFAQSLIALFR